MWCGVVWCGVVWCGVGRQFRLLLGDVKRCVRAGGWKWMKGERQGVWAGGRAGRKCEGLLRFWPNDDERCALTLWIELCFLLCLGVILPLVRLQAAGLSVDGFDGEMDM